MKKVKLAIVYQVIFHYRIPFYEEIEIDSEIDSILLYGRGVKGTKVQNAKHSLKNTSKLFSLRFPYKLNNNKKYFSFFPFLFFKLIIINPDVVLLEGTSSIINNISTYIYSKLFRKKIIFWSLGKVRNKKISSARKKVDKLVLMLEKNADAIFTYSTLGMSYFINRGISKEKIFRGVNVIDTREILKTIRPSKTKKKEFRILFIGSIIPEKKIEILIETFLMLEIKFSNVYLDIIGSGNEYYANLKNKYGHLSKEMIFHGRITKGLEKYYLISDVFVLPGLGGLAISESMAYGLPVICSIADGTEKDLIDKESGFIIKEMNVNTLTDKLSNLFNDRLLLEKIGLNAKERIKTKYSFENYYNAFKESLKYVYES